MYRKVFIDSSAWIAYSLKGERLHEKLKQLIPQLLKERSVFFTSNDVIDETVTRLVSVTNLQIVKTFISFIEQGLKSKTLMELWVDEQVQAEGFRIVEKYFEHKLSLTDATTVALLRRFKIDSVITLDSDFTKIGIAVLP